MRKYIALLFFIIYFSFLQGEEAVCTRGNFALPATQRPGPLISFGENILERNEVQLILSGDDFIGKHKHFIDLEPGIIYGITDRFAVFFSVPIAVDFREENHHSSGLEDMLLQLEYGIYERESSCLSEQISIVANASFPTGSSHKDPSTGFGAMGYFIGATYNRTWTRWVIFTSYGAQFPTAHHRTKFGNSYLYQFGFGRNIVNFKGWIFAWLAETTGTFSKRNRIDGATDPNSGGNVIYFTPSLWASSKHWILQLGFGFAVQQNLFGDQKRNKYLLSFEFRRTF